MDRLASGTDGGQMPPASNEDQATIDRTANLEEAIKNLEKRPGQQEKVKEMNADLAKLQKEPMVNTIAKDNVTLPQLAKEYEEQAEKKLNE